MSANGFDDDDLDDLDDFDMPKRRRKRSNGGVMLDFVTNAFSKFFGILLWINLIANAIAGAVIGGSVRDYGPYWLLGLIIGAIVGMLTNIVFGGVVATFIRMEKNTANTERISAKNEKNTAEILSILKKNANATGVANAADDSFDVGNR